VSNAAGAHLGVGRHRAKHALNVGVAQVVVPPVQIGQKNSMLCGMIPLAASFVFKKLLLL